MPPETTANSLPDRASAPFITFYSFKGGVGRSMALINVAGIMAARGFHVLVIDMDLEAPGLSFLANPGEPEVPASRKQPGVVDFLLDAVEATAEADFFKLSPTDVVERYSAPYDLPEGNPEGSLRIMPAGALDVNYPSRLERLDLPGLYRKGTGLPLFEAFKQTIRDSRSFDYIFIDSRTGFSDESGICTRDLADCLVVVSGLNRQNVEGTSRLLSTLRRSSNGPKLLEIVLSPIPNGEDALVDEREARARAAFSSAWGSELGTDLHIPYHPRLALTEEPHIFRRRRGDLFDAYHRIERRLRELLGHTFEAWLAEALIAYRAENYDSALAFLRRADKVAHTREWADQFALRVNLADVRASAIYDFTISALSSHGRQTVAEQLADAAIEIHTEEGGNAAYFFLKALEASPNNQAILCRYALFLWQIQELAAAERIFERALATEAADPNPDLFEYYALFLWQVRKDVEAAEKMFAKALALAPNEPNALANYGCLCICTGRINEGLDLVDRALTVLPRRRRNPIAAECWMYIYCCGAPERREEALSRLKTLVERSIDTDDWDFSGVIEQAQILEHPHQHWLPVLADVLAHRQPSTVLAEWEAWRLAPYEPRLPSFRKRRD